MKKNRIENEEVVINETSTEFVWNNFCRLFPDMAQNVISYERTGSKMIALHMNDGVTLSFLYYSPVNWNFGTKPWRLKPTTTDKEGTV